jgi:hypothetical protein
LKDLQANKGTQETREIQVNPVKKEIPGEREKKVLGERLVAMVTKAREEKKEILEVLVPGDVWDTMVRPCTYFDTNIDKVLWGLLHSSN